MLLLLHGCDATAPAIPASALDKLRTPSRVSVALDIRRHPDWSSARREKAQAAARVLEAVLNSTAFADQLGNRDDLLRTEGISPAGILRIIRSGTTLSSLRQGDGAANKTITLALSIAPEETEFAHFVGFTDLGTGIIYTQKAWFDEQTICALASLYAHEYMHVVGFSHAALPVPWERRTVPYAIGDLVGELCEKQEVR